MNKITNKKLIYLGLGLGFVRIIINVIISKFDLDFGYLVDVLIFAYCYLWLLLTKQNFFLKYLLLINIIIAAIAIVIFDLFVLFKYSYFVDLGLFFSSRAIPALNILFIALLSSIFYFCTQQLLLNKRK